MISGNVRGQVGWDLEQPFDGSVIPEQALLNASVDGLAFKMANSILNADSHFAEHN